MPLIPISNEAENKKLTDEPKFGTVVSNADPLKLGRVKVLIKGIFEGNADTLPWVRRKMDTLFCGTDCEIFDVPEIGSIVEVRWSYDDNTPIYSGAPYNRKHQTETFTNNYPYEAGFRFGPNYIKFDKASKLLTICNSKAMIQLDALGDCSIACNNLICNVKQNVTLNAANVNIKGNVVVDGDLSCTHGADGNISSLAQATVFGGIVQSVETP